MDLFSFERLEVYDASVNLVTEIYRLLRKFPDYERYDMCSQVRRAIISVPSNIAEGCGRMSYKEKIHFLEYAVGSLFETYAQLEVANRLGYISKEELIEIRPQFFSISRQLNAMHQSYENRLTHKPINP